MRTILITKILSMLNKINSYNLNRFIIFFLDKFSIVVARGIWEIENYQILCSDHNGWSFEKLKRMTL